MAIAVRTSKKKGADIRIDGELNIYSASESHAVLTDLLSTHTKLHVNIEAVEEIDIAGVQLLLMLRREAARTDKTLTFSKPSPAITEIAKFLNIDELMTLESQP